MIAQGILLVTFGLWLLFQTLVGDLPKRVLSWVGYAKPAAAS